MASEKISVKARTKCSMSSESRRQSVDGIEACNDVCNVALKLGQLIERQERHGTEMQGTEVANSKVKGK